MTDGILVSAPISEGTRPVSSLPAKFRLVKSVSRPNSTRMRGSSLCVRSGRSQRAVQRSLERSVGTAMGASASGSSYFPHIITCRDRAREALATVVDARDARVARPRESRVLDPPAHRPDRVARGDRPAGGDLAREGLKLRRDIRAELVRVQVLSCGKRGSDKCVGMVDVTRPQRVVVE